MNSILTDGIALFWLIGMEIVLGIDNIVFITIQASKLPPEKQKLGRRVGIILALVTRIALLWTLFLFMNMTSSIFEWTDIGLPEQWFHDDNGHHVEAGDGSGEEASPDDADESATDSKQPTINSDANGVSIRDLVLLLGGLFLIGKSVYEIHEQINDHSEEKGALKQAATFTSVVIQIAIIDIVFSLDSVITAAGMADHIWIMVVAVLVAVVVMLVFSEVVAKFVEANPTVKMLALSFLILIGVMLVAEGLGAHLDKGYIYFAMFFALVVEFLNLRVRKGS